ncbi:MAG: hypothetical protein Q9195_001216 [Heterodermia aff. obscurata]
MAGFFAVILGTFVSDKIKARGPVMIFCLLCIMAELSSLQPVRNTIDPSHRPNSSRNHAGVFPSSPAVMGWLSNNLAPHYVRATGTGFQLAIANCAAFIATFTYLKKDA